MGIEQKITDLQRTSAEQTAASQALSQEVAGKMGEIDVHIEQASESFRSFIGRANGKYQQLIKTSGKVYGSHLVMYVDPPNYVDPADPSYKVGKSNGILLWRVGEGEDSKKVRPIGFQGRITLTRYGYEFYEVGEFRALRQYISYYLSIEEGLNVGLETMTYQGVEYLVLTSNMSGGGTVILDGLAAFSGAGYSGDTGGIKDNNFGRRVNTKDGSVYDELSPIATISYA